MTEVKQVSALQEEGTGDDGDLTGRRSLIKNILFSWGSQLLFIAAGFIMPRMIDNHLGQELLGVWDFSWSLLSYFYFVQAGVTSAVNRFVGRYWAVQDIRNIIRVVSCATAALAVAGLVVLLMVFTASATLPQFAGHRLREHTSTAQGVIVLLGGALAVQSTLGAFNGVLTGCHRWALQNINQAVWHVVSIIGMVIALQRGGSLVHLAAITFAGDILGQCTRVTLAFRVCRGLRLEKSALNWQTIRELYVYGGKTLIPTLSGMLVNSTTSMLIISCLGPASLALFTRPRSLIRHVDTLVRRMSMTLIPTVSSLEAAADPLAIQNLSIKSVRYTIYLILPILLTFCVFGGAILEIWMGAQYGNSVLMAVLAVGFLVPMTQTPILDILAGLNAHGKAGIAELIGGLMSLGLIALVLGPLKLGLTWAAVGATLPITLISAFYYTKLICAKLCITRRQYFSAIALRPTIHLLPFAVLLIVARLAFPSSPIRGLCWGLALSIPILTLIYWKCVLPTKMKLWIYSKLRWHTGSNQLARKDISKVK